MTADELRRPLTARETAALHRDCAVSGVPVTITDPAALDRAASILRTRARSVA